MFDEGGLFVSESLMHMKALNMLIIDDILYNETIEAVVISNKVFKVLCKGEKTRKVTNNHIIIDFAKNSKNELN